MSRISKCFEKLRLQNRAAFVTFIMAGDPDFDTSAKLLNGMANVGADIIELGVAFTDPMADGPVIQEAGQRALAAGQTLRKTLEMVEAFRKTNHETPIVLMGYFNPFAAYGVDAFLSDARQVGVDGLIVVDLPPEEDNELALPARAAGIDFIRLATPTTDANRTPRVIEGSSGFVYYVSVAGITGRGVGGATSVEAAVKGLQAASSAPIAVGFGVKTPEKAAEFAKFADGVVVGSALVSQLAQSLEETPNDPDNAVNAVLTLTRDIADAIHNARNP